MNKISKNIKRLRQDCVWNQGYVARLLKISNPTYSKIESGKTVINISRLQQIAEIFKISTLDLLYGEATGDKSERALEIEKLNKRLREIEDLIIELQKKVIQYHESNGIVRFWNRKYINTALCVVSNNL